MIIELEVNGAHIIISGDNLTVNVTDAQEPEGYDNLPIPTAELISALRRSLCMSQGDFADHVGVSQAAVCRWENGEREPRGGMAVKLAGLITKHLGDAA
jgi:DNA-binding transcriptional regulator YiaG